MITPDTCQIVVTYRDSNYMWKDRAVNEADMSEITMSPTEHEIHVFSPNF